MSERMTGNMNNNENGFTLIEIMIALVVFSIGMLAIGNLQFSSMIGNSRANRTTEAGNLASSQAELLKQINFNDARFVQRASINDYPLVQQGRFWFRTVVNDNTPLQPLPNSPDGTPGPYQISRTITIRVYDDAAGNNEVLSYLFIKTRVI